MSLWNKYPKVICEVSTNQSSSYFKKCGNCGHELGRNEFYQLKTTQVNWFRGDDKVEALCVNCKEVLR